MFEFSKIKPWLDKYKNNCVIVINGRYDVVAFIRNCEYAVEWCQASNSCAEFPKDLRLYPLTKSEAMETEKEFKENAFGGLRFEPTKSEIRKMSPVIFNY